MDYINRRTVYRYGRVLFVDKFVDGTARTPWEDDGHGPVSDWTKQAKEPGERTLCSDRGGWKRYYNFKEAVELAKRDGWDAPPFKTGTRGEQAARAVETDFDRLRRWCNDDWGYVGIGVTLAPADWDEDSDEVETDFTHVLWGIESDCTDYIETVVEELISEFDLDQTEEEVFAFNPNYPEIVLNAEHKQEA